MHDSQCKARYVKINQNIEIYSFQKNVYVSCLLKWQDTNVYVVLESITFKWESLFGSITWIHICSNSCPAAFRRTKGRKLPWFNFTGFPCAPRGQGHERGYWNSPVTPGQFPEGFAEWTTNMRFWISTLFHTTENGVSKHRHEVLCSSDLSFPNIA